MDKTEGYKAENKAVFNTQYYYLRFKEKDTKRLIEIIKPFVHESMRHKIGERK